MLNPTSTEKQIFSLIQSAKRILLLTDERIDGDTTGSALAMFHYVRSLGKEATMFSPKKWSQEYLFLPGAEQVLFDAEKLTGSYDVMMIFDCADGAYLSTISFLAKSQTPLVVFDHHATNPQYGSVNHIVVEASSTGEVVWRFLKSHNAQMSKEMATCLLTAICTDTTVFTNPSTNQVCMEAAAELCLAGARVQDVVKAVYMNKSVDLLRAWGAVLERLQVLPNDVVVSYLLEKDVADAKEDVDTSAITNFLIGMTAGTRVVAVFSEKADGSVKASLRALSGDVAALAARFGGGGHVKAAGFRIPNARLANDGDAWRIVRHDGAFLPIAEIMRFC